MTSSRRRFLPVVSQGCDRRTALQGISVGVLALLGCKAEDSPGDGADAGVDAFTDPGFEECGADLCFDLTHPTNASLNEVDGARVVTVSPNRYVLIRKSETEFIALSAVCTHQGCTVRFVAASDQLQCPCHGSQFALTGAVIDGPANRPLAVFQTSFDTSTQTVTIRT
jgi:cytochrome b6-f complex iron-sulfur subunit